MKFQFDNQTFTLTKTCDICEHEDYLFLFSFYIQKNKSIILIKDEFKNFIDNHIWQQSGNNTVSYSHYQTLVDTSADEMNIDFSDVPYLSYDDYEIDYKSIDISIAYAIWGAFGILLISTIGIIFFNEHLSVIKVISILFIIIGTVGLRLAN